MSPEFDYGKLTTTALRKICKAGEDKAGYDALQQATALLQVRVSVRPVIRALEEEESWVSELPQDDIDNLNSIIAAE